VLKRCDENIYGLPFAAEAYAFVHLVDRYRRFWDVLEALLRVGALPVRETALDVLDVGTGPAPALYAVNDFFEEMRTFATGTADCQRLHTVPPRLRSIEDSKAMIHLVHNLSEFTGRPGPFRPDRTKFEGFDPPAARVAKRERLIEELIDVWDYSEPEARFQVQIDQADWQGIDRYHFCIFSNFLTRVDDVLQRESELTHVFRALKPGGLVVVVGGSGSDYPRIYESIEGIAKKSNARRLGGVPNTIRCDYHNVEAEQIKQLYCSIFNAVEQLTPLDDVKKTLPRNRDLWDPSTPLRGPREFSIRAYRGPNRPPGTRFTRQVTC
jgi:hypothetical protein